jgi:hypothetical protein
VDWVDGDFEAGDILTFSSYTITKPCAASSKSISASPGRTISSHRDMVEAKSLLPHCDLTWEQITDWVQEPEILLAKLTDKALALEDSYLNPSAGFVDDRRSEECKNMKINEVRSIALMGRTDDSGWDSKLDLAENLHTLVKVVTDEDYRVGSVYSQALVDGRSAF